MTHNMRPYYAIFPLPILSNINIFKLFCSIFQKVCVLKHTVLEISRQQSITFSRKLKLKIFFAGGCKRRGGGYSAFSAHLIV